ncbi:hypothetical protein BJX76DRAFT_233530 [Aspergillus varians]
MSYNQYGGPPGQDQGYYGGGPGYGGQNGNYPPPQQYGGQPGGQPQQGYYPPQQQQPYGQPPHDPYSADPPPYQQGHQQYPQQGAYGQPQHGQHPGPYGQDPNLNYGHDRGHSPYPPQQQEYHQPQGGENSAYYGGHQGEHTLQQGHTPVPAGAEGERGLGSTLLGGAAGSFLGHKMGGGALGTVGGAVAGAVGMNAASKLTRSTRKRSTVTAVSAEVARVHQALLVLAPVAPRRITL